MNTKRVAQCKKMKLENPLSYSKEQSKSTEEVKASSFNSEFKEKKTKNPINILITLIALAEFT